MIVLWITSLLFPEARTLYEGKSTHLSSSGGWMLGAAKKLSKSKDVNLHIACPTDVRQIVSLKGDGVDYHLYPGPMMHDWPWNDKVTKKMIEIVQPDIIHIWGTECAVAISTLRNANQIATIVSLQGFLYNLAIHFFDGLSLYDILLSTKSLRKGLLYEQYEMFKRSLVEIKTLRLAKNVIGRTRWDRQLSKRFNPNIMYFHCDEVLRDEFYDGYWTYDQCDKFRIFHSNGTSTHKGLHRVLKILPRIIKRFPKARLIVAGRDIYEMADEKNPYALIIVSMIKKYKLEKYVSFCGSLDANQMKIEMLRANVFILPSSSENSSNALGEAQLLGVPIVASNRGGIPTMIPDEECGYIYPYNNVKQFEYLICKVFENSKSFDNSHMRDIAKNRHDPNNNNTVLLGIYNAILNNSDK